MPTPITPRVGVLRGALLLSCLCQALCAAPELHVIREGGAVPVSSLPGWKPSLVAEQVSLKATVAELDGLAYPMHGYKLRRPDARALEKGANYSLKATLEPLADERVGALWAGTGEGRLLVVAWVVDGQVTRCEPMRFADAREGRRHGGSVKVPAGEEHGHPVVLCWANGAFAPLTEQATTPQAKALQAVFRDDAEALRSLVQGGLNAGAADEHGYTLAHHAAGSGALRCLDFLTSSNVPLSVVSKDDTTPLELAASRGRTSVVHALTRPGLVRVAGRTQESSSPLYLAAESGHAETVQALLALKADPEQVTYHNRTALVIALNNGHITVLDVMLKAGARLDLGSDNDYRVFLTRCVEGDLPMIRFFLAHGMNAKFEQDGRLPLVEAAVRGSPALAKLLLEKGAKINASDELDRSALMLACIAGNTGYAQALLEAGAKLNDLHPQAGTPLHAAVRSGKVELVELLLKAGASVSAVDKRGLTPLDYGVVTENWDTVAKLVAKGGRLNPKSRFADEKLDAVIRGDQEQLLAQLLQDGLSPQHEVAKGWSLRRVANAAKSPRCEQLLAEAGASLDLAQPCAIAVGKLDSPMKRLSGDKLVDPRIPSLDLPAAELTLRVLVGPDGAPVFSEIEQCTDRMLCVGLTNTVRSWRFTPPQQEGKPVAVWVQQMVRYSSMKEKLKERPTFDSPPTPIKQEKPIYPLAMRARGRMAEVLIGFTITDTGRVIMPYVVRSSGREFEQPSLDCVRKWKFEPAKIKGKPVRTHAQVPIIFSLND